MNDVATAWNVIERAGALLSPDRAGMEAASRRLLKVLDLSLLSSLENGRPPPDRRSPQLLTENRRR
jgi:hypothetical protein